ncbi:MAG: FMN-binding negative transcriptional regulator [Paracoccaceae bacterium]
MHPNPAFRKASADRNLAFARERGFGILTVNGATGPVAAHVPFVLAKDGQSAELHLVRSNPVARALATPQPALLAVSGPDAYVSPDWYGPHSEVPDQVPTWNYVAVHLRGRLELLPETALRDHLDRLSAEFENRLLPKPPWLAAKVSDDTLNRFMRAIVPARLTVENVQGTWKLNQNKPDEVRLRAATTVGHSAIGSETAAIAALMRNPDPA